MNCSQCGNALFAGARFCSHCGAPVIASPMPPPVVPAGYAAMPWMRPYNRVATHLQILGILWFVYAALRGLTGLFGLAFLRSFFGMHGNNGWGTAFGWSPFSPMGLEGFWPLIVTTLVVSVGLALMTGIALLTRQPWGRVFAIIFGIFALLHPPLGTALGIYTLWVLAPRVSGMEYASIAAAAAQTRR